MGLKNRVDVCCKEIASGDGQQRNNELTGVIGLLIHTALCFSVLLRFFFIERLAVTFFRLAAKPEYVNPSRWQW